jgi:predicted nucleic acid-binding protein
VRRFYIDTNIFAYVALRHPKYGPACKRITDDIRDEKIEAHCSLLVPAEILGSLAKVNPRISAGALVAFFTFPIRLIPLDEAILHEASRIMIESGVGYDSIHAAAMKRNNLKTVLTEDVDRWKKIKGIKVVRPLEYGG